MLEELERILEDVKRSRGTADDLTMPLAQVVVDLARYVLALKR